MCYVWVIGTRGTEMTNDQMKANRFARWHKARKIIAWIAARHAEGRKVHIVTNTRRTVYGPKLAGMFKATKTGAYVQNGKSWVCIDYCTFQAE